MLPKSMTLLALGLLLAAAPAFAHGDAHDGHETHAAVPAGTLEEHIAKLETLVTGRQLKDTHEVIEAATSALQATVPPAAQKARFEGAARQLQQQLNALHTAADAGDQAGSERALKKVRAAYQLLKATLRPS
jgi:hypothetical protein